MEIKQIIRKRTIIAILSTILLSACAFFMPSVTLSPEKLTNMLGASYYPSGFLYNSTTTGMSSSLQTESKTGYCMRII